MQLLNSKLTGSRVDGVAFPFRSGIIWITAVLITSSCYAQDSMQVDPRPPVADDSVARVRQTDGFTIKPGFPGKKIAASGFMGAWIATSLVWSYDSWWKGNAGPFHFQSEQWLNSSTLGIDKVGHLYTSYFYYNLFRNVLLWGGCEESTADGWAVGSAAFFAVSVEIGDGFASTYGFDYQDVLFNFLGAGYGWLQHRVPALEPFGLKWSFVPASGYRFPVRFTDDYDAHTYWLTCKVHKLLPDGMKQYWPDFVELAVGYGVDDHVTKREFVVGLDVNVLELFKPIDENWLLGLRVADLFHIPAPAVKVTEGKGPRYYFLHKN